MRLWLLGASASNLRLLLLGLKLAFAGIIAVGLVWAFDKIDWYMAAASAVALCISILLLPFAVFRSTRRIASRGLQGTSLVFALCTWATAILVASDHWGLPGVLAGLLLGIVGIIPVGILASLLHADWLNAIGLVIAVLMTIGTLAFALWLETKAASEPEISRSPDGSSEFPVVGCETGFADIVDAEFSEVVKVTPTPSNKGRAAARAGTSD